MEDVKRAYGYEAIMPSSSLTGKVLKSKWRLGALIGTGACADVYEASDVSLGATTEAGMFVAKVAPVPVDLPPRPSQALLEKKRNADLLHWEHTLYQGYLRPLRDPGYVVDVSFPPLPLLIRRLSHWRPSCTATTR